MRNLGSDTMLEVGFAWAEAYDKVNDHVVISLSGGGSGTGIAELIAGQIHIANSSRRLKDVERKRAEARGRHPVEHLVGYDGIAIFVHRDNPLASISIAQLQAIFGDGGELVRWSQLGVDLGGTKIAAVVLSPDGGAVWESRVATPRDDYAATLEAVARLVEAGEAAAGVRCSVGVGTPGAISPATGLLKNANSVWLNGRPFDRDLAARLGMIPTAPGLLRRWLEELVRRRHLRADGDHFVADASLPAIDPEAIVRGAADLFADFPAPLDYVTRSGARLVDLLTGRESPLEVLFPGGSTDMADALYSTSALARYSNAIATGISLPSLQESLILLGVELQEPPSRIGFAVRRQARFDVIVGQQFPRDVIMA